MLSRLLGRKTPAPPGPEPAPATVPARPAPAVRTRVSDPALFDALVESRQRFKEIVEASGDFAWETDADGAFVFVSPGGTLGHAPGDMVGKAARFFFADGETRRNSPFTAREATRDVEIRLRCADGATAILRTSAVPVRGRDGSPTGTRGVCRDITEERREHDEFVAMQLREAQMGRIVRAAASELDPEAMLQTALSETRNALSADHVELRRPDGDGQFVAIASASDGEGIDAPVLANVLRRMNESRSLVTAADGDNYYLCAPTVFRGAVTGAVLVIRSLSRQVWTDGERDFSNELATQFAIMLEQIDNHRKLDALARHDELTGLLNRRAFFDELRDRLARIGSGSAAGSMFYVDFDNFKLVNDVHGHKRGDEALKSLSDLLTANSRPGDLVARLGGDEFAMWLERTDEEAARKRAAELLETSAGLRIFSGAPDCPLGISVGVAVVPKGSDETIQDLAARADQAMYRIKKNGKSGFEMADVAPVSDEGGESGTSPAGGEAAA
jgi:diguanylate cyclase (GGDEF)-like protein/PAS domain S-box-containing protein